MKCVSICGNKHVGNFTSASERDVKSSVTTGGGLRSLYRPMMGFDLVFFRSRTHGEPRRSMGIPARACLTMSIKRSLEWRRYGAQ